MKSFVSALLAGVAMGCALGAPAQAASEGRSSPVPDRTVLPLPQPSYKEAVAGETYADSRPARERLAGAPEKAPNVVLVLTDDVGFGAASTFGGVIETPNLDRLAQAGLRYNRFHTTAMCSPTRAALLTGRNHHGVGSGVVTDLAAGYAGYSGVLPVNAVTVAEILRLNGYNTAMFGKHHNVQPGATSPAGPFDQWPTGLGFEYFYGFVAAQTDQFSTNLYRGISPEDMPADKLLDEVLVDDAIRWVHNQQAADPNKPFFVYLATGTLHAPHQAPRAWIEKYKGRFDGGWDKLRADIFRRQKEAGVVPANARLPGRPETIPAWNSLSADQRRVNARMMEVAAAALSFQDHQFGRLITELDRMGELENTLVIFIQGDNGAAAEGGLFGSSNPMGGFANGFLETDAERLADLDKQGGPESLQNWGAGWAWATSTPLRWTKSYASHLGGVRNGMVLSWPAKIREAGLRAQFHHVVDIAPTILEAAGVPQPEVVHGVRQKPMDGISLGYTFNAAAAPERRRTQYFEMLGNRAIYHDGWWAGTTPSRVSWLSGDTASKMRPDEYRWELYNLNEDFSQSTDLAAKYPQKLDALKAVFDAEAQRHQVYPLDDRLDLPRFANAAALGHRPRAETVYWGKNITLPAEAAPRLSGTFSIEAEITTTADARDGVLLATGGRFAGWSFYLKDGKPVAVMAGANQPSRIHRVESPRPVPVGAATVRYDYVSDGPGRGGSLSISVNGEEVASGRIEQTYRRLVEMNDTFDVGYDRGLSVTNAYVGNGAFEGDIHKVTVTTPEVVRPAGIPQAVSGEKE